MKYLFLFLILCGFLIALAALAVGNAFESVVMFSLSGVSLSAIKKHYGKRRYILRDEQRADCSESLFGPRLGEDFRQDH